MNISVIGLGKLGSPMAAWIASKGHGVAGVDVNPQFCDLINEGKAPVDEPGLDDLIFEAVKGKETLRASTDHRVPILATDMTFIVVPTPSIKTGAFSIKWVKAAAKQIGLALNQKDSYHLVVITSTVMPGHTQAIVDALESYSGKKCGEDFGVCYNPEFIALGSVLHDLKNPDFVLIGQSDPGAGRRLARFYSGMLRPDVGAKLPVPIYRTSFVNAEIAKLALNCYVTTKISFANMIGRVCEDFPGADTDEVTGAIGLDSRIGPKFLTAGTPFGGPCFPRDNEALMSLMARHEMALPMATKAENLRTLARITKVVTDRARINDAVGIVGMSYKPGTTLTEESASIKLQNALVREERTVYTWNMEGALLALTDFVDECDVVVFMLPYTVGSGLYSHFEGKVIVDPWRCLNSESVPDSATYVPLGRGK